MRAGAERDAFLGIARDVEIVGVFKAGLVAIGRAEHEEHAILRREIDAAVGPRLRHPPRRHPDRCDPARIFLEHVEPLCLAVAHLRQLIGVGHERPDRAGDGVARLVLAA